MQITKSSQLEFVDPKIKKSSLLVDGETFQFGLMSSIKVDFLDCNATTTEDGSPNLKGLEKWLSNIV